MSNSVKDVLSGGETESEEEVFSLRLNASQAIVHTELLYRQTK